MPKEKVNITALPDLRVLQICRNLWAWLVKHPGKEKDEWPGWKYTARGCLHAPVAPRRDTKPPVVTTSQTRDVPNVFSRSTLEEGRR
jgi:hypothetical protein